MFYMSGSCLKQYIVSAFSIVCVFLANISFSETKVDYELDAIKAYEAKEYSRAVGLWRAAYSESPDPFVWFNMFQTGVSVKVSDAKTDINFIDISKALEKADSLTEKSKYLLASLLASSGDIKSFEKAMSVIRDIRGGLSWSYGFGIKIKGVRAL